MIRRVSAETLAQYWRFPCARREVNLGLTDTQRVSIQTIQTIQSADPESLSLAEIQELVNCAVFGQSIENPFQVSEDAISVVSNWYQKYHVRAESLENFQLEAEVPSLQGNGWYCHVTLPIISFKPAATILTFADTEINQLDLYHHPWYRFTTYLFHKRTGQFPAIERLQIRPKSVELRQLNVGKQTEYLRESENMLRSILSSFELEVFHCNRGCRGVETECSRYLIPKGKLSLY